MIFMKILLYKYSKIYLYSEILQYLNFCQPQLPVFSCKLEIFFVLFCFVFYSAELNQKISFERCGKDMSWSEESIWI